MEHTDKHSVLINTVYFVFINILITSYTHIILAFQDGVTSHIAREQTLHNQSFIYQLMHNRVALKEY